MEDEFTRGGGVVRILVFLKHVSLFAQPLLFRSRGERKETLALPDRIELSTSL
jgi:hypothetical protein